jgi:hypothetical protein
MKDSELVGWAKGIMDSLGSKELSHDEQHLFDQACEVLDVCDYEEYEEKYFKESV